MTDINDKPMMKYAPDNVNSATQMAGVNAALNKNLGGVLAR